MELKAREDRARRKLKKMGYKLTKSSSFQDVIGYMIIDLKTNGVVSGSDPSFSDTIEDVEEWIYQLYLMSN